MAGRSCFSVGVGGASLGAGSELLGLKNMAVASFAASLEDHRSTGGQSVGRRS